MSEYPLTRQEWFPGQIRLVDFREPAFGGGFDYWHAYMENPSYLKFLEVRSPLVEGSRKTWNSFEHYKVQCDPGNGGLGSAIITVRPLFQNFENAVNDNAGGPFALYSSAVFGAAGLMTDGLTPLYVPSARTTGFITDPSGLNEMIDASLRSMLPLLRPKLSAVNSAIELKDFKSLKGTIQNILKLPRGALRRYRKFRNVWHILQVAADVYLQMKFNINPLISDIHGIYRAVAETEKRLNALISRAGKLQVSHFSKNLPADSSTEENEPLGRGVGSYALPGGQFQSGNSVAFNSRITISDASQFHAQLQYNYHYSAYQLEHARVLGLLDSLGVNLNPAIVWNAIPWSFVVDWLVDVGQWLGTQRIGNMDPKINIMQYCWSVKRSRRVYVTSKIVSPKYYPGTGLPGSYVQSITHPVITETSYKRSVGLPSASSITSSGLNPTEFSLGAALVISRRRRRHKSMGSWK